jgi:hypothetical protein
MNARTFQLDQYGHVHGNLRLETDGPPSSVAIIKNGTVTVLSRAQVALIALQMELAPEEIDGAVLEPGT